MKFQCEGCGCVVPDTEEIPDKVQDLLLICNDCVDRPFSDFLVYPTKSLNEEPSEGHVRFEHEQWMVMTKELNAAQPKLTELIEKQYNEVKNND
ncbi:hypothetical protein [Peribacillus huizhouensis]|uniref:Uncharacterized protein n=1 Tax=Peribacillus huizhouensis TaxID=1501239 RepID=A0ABR6CV42_9BACI|nr:hypothetical protein [Peribacillus huizhouensis]MBA9028596.1 hypothetical protein [Peribacillus huizhouensis]